jgi:putative DNA primase/helicase
MINHSPEHLNHSSATSKLSKAAIESAEACPEVPPVLPDRIPGALKALPQWVAWRWERCLDRRKKKWTKVPINPKMGDNASSTNTKTWGTFEKALAFYHQHAPESIAGIGFVFTASDPFAGVDLDDCRDPVTGTIADWAQAEITTLASYTEVSPTGTGVKIWVQGKLPSNGRRRKPYELYDAGRFFTMTGMLLPGAPTTVEERQAELSQLHARLFGPKEKANPKPKPAPAPTQGNEFQLTDEQILERARAAHNGDKFSRLWAGDTTGYPSDSEADLALCSMVAFWTGPDSERIDRLFRQSSLWRAKWDEFRGEQTYGQRTIAKALGDKGNFFSKGGTAQQSAQRSSSNGQGTANSQNDSFPKASQAEGTIWRPVPISQLRRIAPPDTWVWEGILAPGKITLLSAEAKAGKTTLLSLLYQRMASGGSLCGATVYPGRVIVVSEEPADLWLDRRQRLSLGDHVEVLPMPFITKPRQHDWEKMIAEAVQALRQQPAALVVWDTLSHLWWLADENDNAKEAAALMPLRQLCDTGAGLALLHHFGAEKNGPRGGTELRGFPDVLAELHLYKRDDFEDRRRVLKVRGRLQQLPSKLVVQLNETADDYVVLEGALDVGSSTLWAVLSTLVPAHSPGLSAKEFQELWPEKPPPEAKRLNEVLAKHWEAAGWQRTGAGKKNDPYCYWRPKQDEK